MSMPFNNRKVTSSTEWFSATYVRHAIDWSWVQIFIEAGTEKFTTLSLTVFEIYVIDGYDASARFRYRVMIIFNFFWAQTKRV